MYNKINKIIILSALTLVGISSLTSCDNSPTNPTPIDIVIPSEGITVDKTEVTVSVGLSALVKCSVLPENATNKKLTWKSNDESIATVNKGGVISGISEGETTISVIHEDGWTKKIQVTVTKEEIKPVIEETIIEIDKANLILKIGEEETLNATITNANNDNILKWNSLNPKIATVTNSGKVKAISPGTTKIVAYYGIYSATCEIKVDASDIEFVDIGNVSIQNDVVSEYLSKQTLKDQYDFLKTHTNTKSSDPENDFQEYVLTWNEQVHNEYRVLISKNKNLSEPIVNTLVDTNSYNYGLFVPGETYYALVTNEVSNLPLLAQKFTINENEVRFINAPKAKNVRDLGGWSIGENNLNYQLLYRGGCLNGSTGIGKLNEEGINIFKNDLKIKTEIDLRAFDSDSNGHQTQCYFNEKANYVTADLKEKRFDHIFTNSQTNDGIKLLMSTLADKDNYPVYFHCNEGATRTGTIAFLLEGLLGVSYENIVKDYELTNFSQSGSRRWRTHSYNDSTGFDDLTNLSYSELVSTTPNKETGRNDCGYNIDAMYVYIMENYLNNGASLKDAVNNYLLNIGVSQNEINSFKEIMTSKEIAEEIISRKDDEDNDKTICFVTLKGLSDGDIITPVQKGKTLEIGTPKETAKIFKGWFLENGEEFDMSTPIVEDLVLVAHWDEFSDVVTENKITVFELTKDAASVIVGDKGKVANSEDTIEFYELKNGKCNFDLPKINFTKYKMIEFDVQNNWAFAYLSFGSSEDNLIQFGKNNTRYRYTIQINCETGEIYFTKIKNIANGEIVSNEKTKIDYVLTQSQLKGITPLVLGYEATKSSSSYGFKLTSAFTYLK